MTDTSLINIAVNVFASPGEAYPAIRERPRAFLPWFLIVAGICSVTMLYTSSVDVGWYLEPQVRASLAGSNLSEAEMQEAVDNVANIRPLVLGAIGALSSAAFLTLLYFVHALYLTGVSFVRHDDIRLKQWFSLICWCSLPSLLGFLASLVNLLTNDATFMRQEQVNPLSFGSLFGLEAQGTGDRILQTFDLTSIWSLVLIVLGYQAWTGKSLGTSALIALGPYILIAGISLAVSIL